MLAALPPDIEIFLQIVETATETFGESFAAKNRPGGGFLHRVDNFGKQKRLD